LIKRSQKRFLVNHCEVELALKSLAHQYGLEYFHYPDNPIPNVNTTLDVFSRAAVIVAPHGAGLANLVLVPSGAFVVEVLMEQDINLCYQALSYQLGHRWHGLLSSTPLPALTANETEIEEAVRAFLEHRLVNNFG